MAMRLRARWEIDRPRMSATPCSVTTTSCPLFSAMRLTSASRPALQAFLAAWQPVLHATRAHPEAQGLVRWAVDVDPLVL